MNFHGNPKSTRKLVASGNSDIEGIGTIWPHNLQKSVTYVSHLEEVFSNVRQRCGLKPGDVETGRAEGQEGVRVKGENVLVNSGAVCDMFHQP